MQDGMMDVFKKYLRLLILAFMMLSACTAPPQQPSPAHKPPAAPAATATALAPLPDPTQRPSTTPTSGSRDPRAQAVIAELIPYYDAGDLPGGPMDLASRMTYFQVPGLSIAVVDGGELVWAEGFGVSVAGGPDPVTASTLFQAASMSKPVSAVAALTLVRDGLLDLDANVNQVLASWQVPESELTVQNKVTLRRLLSHTAGLTVHGFSGYPLEADLPTLPQILDGQPPANSPAVRVAAEPGSGFDYSGGGYVVLQQLLEDVTGQPFAALLHDRVLEPAGMDGALFAQPLIAEWPGALAAGHLVGMQPIPGGSRVYPELAPAGLWATPSDLARFLIAVGQAEHGQPGALLPPELAELMLTPVAGGNGLGWVLPGDGAAGMYGHGGSNAGFRGLMFAVRGTGQAAVVMANSDTAMDLIFEVFRSIQRAYGWPDAPQWRAAGRETLALPEPVSPADPALAGDYAAGSLVIRVSVGPDGGLALEIPAGGPAYPLYPLGNNQFATIDGARWTFDPAAGVLRMDGWGAAEQTARRVE